MQGRLGGGEGIEGLYGSITGRDLARIFESMRDHCGLGPDSCLVDVGAGLGRPLVHALLLENVTGAFGIELDTIKCRKAEAFLRQTFSIVEAKPRYRARTVNTVDIPKIANLPIEHVDTLDPATHAYSFWEGVPIAARMQFGRLFAASKTLHTVAVVQRCMSHARQKASPADIMESAYCFGPLHQVESFSVKMGGSGRSFTAYVFRKAHSGKDLPDLLRPAMPAYKIASEMPSQISPQTPPLPSSKRCSVSLEGDEPQKLSVLEGKCPENSDWTRLPEKRVRKRRRLYDACEVNGNPTHCTLESKENLGKESKQGNSACLPSCCDRLMDSQRGASNKSNATQKLHRNEKMEHDFAASNSTDCLVGDLETRGSLELNFSAVGRYQLRTRHSNNAAKSEVISSSRSYNLRARRLAKTM